MAPTRTALLVALLVGSFNGHTSEVVPQTQLQPTVVEARQAAGIATYTIDPAVSGLHVLVYRAGKLGRLGHNHIISAGQITGSVYLHPDVADSEMELTLPVAGFVIDDPRLRQAEGDEFASVPSAKDINGTRRNMVSKKLLDIENFPEVRVTGRKLEIDSNHASIEITMKIKNAQAVRRVPLTLTMNEDQITAQGELDLTHEELGLSPFRVMLGALKVADTMRVRFTLTAQKI